MSQTVYELKRISSEGLGDLSQRIIRAMENTGAEMIYHHLQAKEEQETLLLVFEKYYFRNDNYAALTIQCVRFGEEQTAVAIGTGGGGGLLNVSWGANGNFAKSAQEVLEKMGFQ